MYYIGAGIINERRVGFHPLNNLTKHKLAYWLHFYFFFYLRILYTETLASYLFWWQYLIEVSRSWLSIVEYIMNNSLQTPSDL